MQQAHRASVPGWMAKPPVQDDTQPRLRSLHIGGGENRTNSRAISNWFDLLELYAEGPGG